MITIRTGVDIGQISDPTAICVAEEQQRAAGTHFLCRHLERLPLGTSYPSVCDRIVEIQNSLEAKSRIHAAHSDDNQGFRLELYIDSTGIGLAISDELKSRGLRPVSCFFVSGDRRSERNGETVSIGKSWAVGRLQVLLQSGRIHLPDTSEAAALVHELQSFEITVSDSGHASFNARSGKHDDLVTALALSVGADTPAGASFTCTTYLGGPALGIEERRQRDLRRAGRGGR